MNATKKLICMLAAGATLAMSASVFADSGRGRDRDYYRDHRPYGYYDRNGHGHQVYRGYGRDFDHRRFVVVQRPVIVERPAYYVQPAPPVVYGIGPAAIIGATIGVLIDNNR